MPRELSPAQIAERSIQKKYVKTLWNPFIAAMKQYQLIEAGDCVAACISGGKDSFLTAKLLQMLQRHSDVPFELKFLCMDPGYKPHARQLILDNAAKLGIPLEIFDTNIFNYVAKQGGSPCYLCARMRRGYLYKEAQARGCNKIALGHHFNDVIETTLMSVLYSAQTQSMPPKLHSQNFEGLQLIRPLYQVREEHIIAWGRYNAMEFLLCGCPLTEDVENPRISKRREVKNLIAQLKLTHPDVEKCIFHSTHNVRLDTMVSWTHKGLEHSFLDNYEKF